MVATLGVMSEGNPAKLDRLARLALSQTDLPRVDKALADQAVARWANLILESKANRY